MVIGRFDLRELEKDYELELDRVVSEIKKGVLGVRSKGLGNFKVLLQLPDGLKPWGPSIVDYLEEKTCAEIRIWLGECFGACDVPYTSCDLVVQFGHTEW